MNSDYVFLCGVMWCRYGKQEAGRELLKGGPLSRSGYQHSCLGYVCERKDCPQGEICSRAPIYTAVKVPYVFDDLLEPAHT